MDRSFFHFVRDHAFDGRTDRETDGRTDRILIARPRLHSMQRGKNAKLVKTGRGLDHVLSTSSDLLNKQATKVIRIGTRCSTIAGRPRCRVRYSFRQK